MMNTLLTGTLAAMILTTSGLPIYPGATKSPADPSTREKCGHEVTTTAAYFADGTLDAVNTWYRHALPNGTPISTAGLMKKGMSLQWDMILTNGGSTGVVIVPVSSAQVVITFAQYKPPITGADLERFKTCN